MANIKSAKKRARQSEVHREHNASLRSRMRTAIKRVRKAIDAGDKTGAASALRSAYSVLDSTVGKGVVHRNMAARSKSRLAAAIKSMA
jgi:small subunit ribosomal protein S20